METEKPRFRPLKKRVSLTLDPGVQPEMKVVRAIIEARTSQNLTQKELAEKAGINQTEISKLENGTRNPSIRLLQRLADGMGMVLDISFKPKHKEVKA